MIQCCSIAEPQSDRYFSPKIAWNNCQAEVQCVSASLNHSDNPVCTVWYTTGPEQVNFSIRDNQLSSKFGTQFAFQGLTADTTYYFHFEVVVNSSLCIVETLNITTDSSKIHVKLFVLLWLLDRSEYRLVLCTRLGR